MNYIKILELTFKNNKIEKYKFIKGVEDINLYTNEYIYSDDILNTNIKMLVVSNINYFNIYVCVSYKEKRISTYSSKYEMEKYENSKDIYVYNINL